MERKLVQILFLFVFPGLSFAQNYSRPTFPPVFQTEVEGILHLELEELSASVYYDYEKNRAALFYTYQNISTRSIYDFETNQLIYLKGTVCDVADISEDVGESFFRFTTDDNNKKHIDKAEDILFFSNSELVEQNATAFPTYEFQGVIKDSSYFDADCNITHVFTRPIIERPECDNHACIPTLMSISVRCADENGTLAGSYSMRFHRFRETIEDESVFLPPPGVHCNLKSTKEFPVFPAYFSFTFDVTSSDLDASEDAPFYVSHKKVWFDRDHLIIRIDEFDDDAFMTSSRIYDLKKEMVYTIVAVMSTCEMGRIEEFPNLGEITSLPKIFFSKNPETLEKAIYVGKRRERGLNFDVWTLDWTDEESDDNVVMEMYFLKTAPTFGIATGEFSEDDFILQISHTNTYYYERREEQVYELSTQVILEINNFRYRPKEWAAYDIASCFSNEQKKGFKLLVEGPPLVKESHLYHDILEQLYDKITEVTKVSILRINELTGVFDGVHLTEITGWILESNISSSTAEHDMNETYRVIESSAEQGLLSVTVTKDKTKVLYNITRALSTSDETDDKGDKDDKDDKTTPSNKGHCFSGTSMAVACIIPLLAGFAIGGIGYRVFLTKRKPSSVDRLPLDSLQ
ncbi:uncharacterized protein LOC129229819 [Uloborus diversus]|uniref:uncharacterized protein LOC129229819 n=1 Tax=Uloborus diversus TaxID=327109 RepID=UPI00240A45E2|nr:uncharacterized protein LOC129229819 [Uloborus diversus]